MALSYPQIKKKSSYVPPQAKNAGNGANPYVYNPGGDNSSNTLNAMTSGVTNQQPQSYYGGEVQQRTALSSLPENLANAYQNTLSSMMSGAAYSPYKTAQMAAMNKGAQQMRANAQIANVGRAGQGTAIANKNAAESSIAQMAGQTSLNAMMGEQEMKERGLTATNNLASMNENVRNTDIQQGMATDTQYGYVDRLTGNRIKGSNELAESQVNIQQQQADTARDLGYAQLSSGEKIAFAQIGLDEKKLSETARQFGISTDQAAKQFQDSLGLEYSQLSQNQKQFMTAFGLDEARFNESKAQFGETMALEQQKLQSAERLTMKQIGVDEARLSETARQFNISTDQASDQFKQMLEKDYAELSVMEKQFADTLGLDQAKFEQAKLEFGVQTDIQLKQIESQEKIAYAGLDIDQQRIDEAARQFGITTEQADRQFKDNLKLEYNQLDQQQKQFMDRLGFDEAQFNESKSQFKHNLALENYRVQQTERLATEQLGLERSKLSETARQFGISTAMAADQFTKSLSLDYESLSQRDKEFATQMGFNREQFEQAKIEFDKNYSLQNKLQTRDLDIKEKALAQEGAQFDSKLDFDKWAIEKGLENDVAGRLWQANQNEKAINADWRIRQMVNNTDVWKTQEATRLTQMGWDREEAQAYVAREHEELMFNLQSELTREVEQGRISQQEADRVQQARQFDTQADWMREAKGMDMDEATAQRLWATSERIANNANTSLENTFDRQFQKDLASGHWVDDNGNLASSMQAKQLAQSARQASDQLDWMKKSKAMDISEAQAERIWRSVERIEENMFKENFAKVQADLALKGIKLSTSLSYLESLEPEAAADALQNMAVEAGMKYIVRGDDGKAIYDPVTKEPVTREGFPPQKSNVTQKGYDLVAQMETGALGIASFKGAENTNHPEHDDYQAIMNTASSWGPIRGRKVNGDQTITNRPSIGSIVKYDDGNGPKLYRVNSHWSRNGQDHLSWTDINTGVESGI